VLRYSAGAASRQGHPSHQANKPKLITPVEYQQLDRYYVVLANSEWYEGRVTEGDLAGQQDGQADFELWAACGYPQGYPVFCSWDKYPNATEIAGVAAYLAGHQRGMDAAAGGRYYVTDLYAGENGIRAMQGQGLAPIGWRTMASSWNDFIPASQTVAAIVQTGNYWYGNQADENVMARDLALPGGAVPEDGFMAALTDEQQQEMYDWLRRLDFGLATGVPVPYKARGELLTSIRNIEKSMATSATVAVLAKQLQDLATAVAAGSVTLSDEQVALLAAAIELPPYSGHVTLIPTPVAP
jgi:hypothetical protein